MNIAREIGSLISGLLAPQGSSRVTAAEKGLLDRSGNKQRNKAEPIGSAENEPGSDRVTLSQASLSLLKDTQEQTPSIASAETKAPRSSELLALPYSPSSAGESEQQNSQNPSNAIYESQSVQPAESPATRQLVRTTYGSGEHASKLPAPPTISFHA